IFFKLINAACCATAWYFNRYYNKQPYRQGHQSGQQYIDELLANVREDGCHLSRAARMPATVFLKLVELLRLE
ncbi:hypothetical protein HK096_001760, partial [Nowakowskiella sp. JEL0078]